MQGFYLEPNTWSEDLQLDIPVEDFELVPPPDIEAIFYGLKEFLADKDGIEIIYNEEELQEKLGTSAPLLVPGTRIFIRAEATLRDWLKKLVKTAAMYTIVGSTNPKVAFAGLTIDFVITILDKISRLNETDVNLVQKILQLCKSKEGVFPTTADIAATIENGENDVETRLTSLKDRGIIQQNQKGWQVVF